MVEKVLQLNREKYIFWTLLGTLFICAGFYIYFINATIHNAVAVQNLESEASSLTVGLGAREFEYITKRSAVTVELAYSLGFKDTEVKSYISKKSNSAFAFLNR